MGKKEKKSKKDKKDKKKNKKEKKEKKSKRRSSSSDDSSSSSDDEDNRPQRSSSSSTSTSSSSSSSSDAKPASLTGLSFHLLRVVLHSLVPLERRRCIDAVQRHVRASGEERARAFRVVAELLSKGESSSLEELRWLVAKIDSDDQDPIFISSIGAFLHPDSGLGTLVQLVMLLFWFDDAQHFSPTLRFLFLMRNRKCRNCKVVAQLVCCRPHATDEASSGCKEARKRRERRGG